MLPAIVLVVSFAVLRSIGFLGVNALDNWDLPLRLALFVMFLLTASAHWGRGRPDLIRMVPTALPAPSAIVTVTGILEILGALGLILTPTIRAAAICLAVMLAAMFPANIRAAREKLTIMGRRAPTLAVRTFIQAIFMAALMAVAFHER